MSYHVEEGQSLTTWRTTSDIFEMRAGKISRELVFDMGRPRS